MTFSDPNEKDFSWVSMGSGCLRLVCRFPRSRASALAILALAEFLDADDYCAELDHQLAPPTSTVLEGKRAQD